MKKNINMLKAIPALFILSVIAIFCSCGNFLEETSQDEFEPKTTESFSELLLGEGYALANGTLDAITDFMSDDITTTIIQYYTPTAEVLARKAAYTWQPDMFEILDEENYYASIYETHYKRIMICNMVIELIPGSQGAQASKDQLMGEALTLRSFYYLQLVNFFAKPYNDKSTSPENSLGVVLALKSEVLDSGEPRNSVKEVYDQITSDIEKAITLLEKNKDNMGVFRINHTAARLLASRIYLYMEEWDKVIEHSSAALQSAPGLCYLPDYVLRSYNDRFATNEYQQRFSNENGVISKDFPETIFLSQGRSLPNMMYSPSTELIDSYDVSDSRRDKYFMIGSEWNMLWPYYVIKAGVTEMGYVWRTSELYLNRAEAYMMKYKNGDAASGQLAVSDLNTLRRNRFAEYTDYQLGTDGDLETFYKAERRRELMYEGHRWFDLRRFGMPRIEHLWVEYPAGTQTRFTLEDGDPGYVLPIPMKVLNRNAKLIQNELAPIRTGV